MKSAIAQMRTKRPSDKKKLPVHQEINILVVDDDPGHRDLLKTALTEEGFFVETANSGLQACQIFDESRFDLVLTDLNMPGLNGIELLKKIKARSPLTLVILITGYASLRSAIEAIRAGAYDYLTKPFQLDELSIVVKNACDRIKLIRKNNNLLDQLKKIHEEASGEIFIPEVEDAKHISSLDLIQSLRAQLLKVYSRASNTQSS